MPESSEHTFRYVPTMQREGVSCCLSYMLSAFSNVIRTNSPLSSRGPCRFRRRRRGTPWHPQVPVSLVEKAPASGAELRALLGVVDQAGGRGQRRFFSDCIWCTSGRVSRYMLSVIMSFFSLRSVFHGGFHSEKHPSAQLPCMELRHTELYV